MKVYKAFKSAVYGISKGLNAVGGVVLISMVVLMCSDIFSRTFFDTSIQGTFELVQNMMLTMVVLAYGQNQADKKNVSVDLLTGKMPLKVQEIIKIVTTALSLAFFVFCAYSNFLQTIAVFERSVTSNVLMYPLWPFNLIMAIGISILCLVLICDIIDMFIEMKEQKNNA